MNFCTNRSLPTLVTVPKLESVTVAEDEAWKLTSSGHGPDLPKFVVCRPECLLKVFPIEPWQVATGTDASMAPCPACSNKLASMRAEP